MRLIRRLVFRSLFLNSDFYYVIDSKLLLTRKPFSCFSNLIPQLQFFFVDRRSYGPPDSDWLLLLVGNTRSIAKSLLTAKHSPQILFKERYILALRKHLVYQSPIIPKPDGRIKDLWKRTVNMVYMVWYNLPQ